MSDEKLQDEGAGLCATCRHAQRVRAHKGTRYIMCRRSHTDRRFAKYPMLPVLTCSGYERDKEDAGG